MLVAVLSCRDNMTNSGVVGPHRRRGDRRRTPPAEHGDRGVPVLPVQGGAGKGRRRPKACASRCAGRTPAPAWSSASASGIYVYPGALFRLTEEEVRDRAAATARHNAIRLGWRDDEAEADDPDQPDADPAVSAGADVDEDAGPWTNPDAEAPRAAAE